MGWLELLPLLKRLLPLLGRLAPTLEAVLVARTANGKDTEEAMQRFAGSIKAEFATAAENHTTLAHTLEQHSEGMRLLTEDVQRLQQTTNQQDARTRAMEVQMDAVATQMTSLSRTVKSFAIVILLLLLACTGLLTALFLRH
jgi:hypothetical protein